MSKFETHLKLHIDTDLGFAQMYLHFTISTKNEMYLALASLVFVGCPWAQTKARWPCHLTLVLFTNCILCYCPRSAFLKALSCFSNGLVFPQGVLILCLCRLLCCKIWISSERSYRAVELYLKAEMARKWDYLRTVNNGRLVIMTMVNIDKTCYHDITCCCCLILELYLTGLYEKSCKALS